MKTNEELLAEANEIEFKFTTHGHISKKHTEYERGLYTIKRAIERHGIEKYLYGRVLYVNATTKTTVVCPLHGDFEITPTSLIKGGGCPKCSNVHQPSTEEWIEKAQKVHGTKYDYSQVLYKSSQEKICIICADHGPFYQTPNNHLSGRGCHRCARELVTNGQTHSKEQFIIKAIEIHGNRYEYSQVSYKNNREKVEIICHTHGPFLQTPANHLSGRGCPQCSGKYSPTTEEWVAKARNVHGDLYDYSKVLYKNVHEKVQIVCNQHGTFWQTPGNHINNFQGCPKCGHHNHNILYLLKCKETGWYKIGITTGDTKRRIQQIGGNVEDVFHVSIEDPRKHETYLHKKYSNAREYNLCVVNGNTEFFSLTEEQVKEVINYMRELK